ncbi:MAG: hypothetical protein JNK46_11865 [Methylobacteriaceae bacterium]|nr:hypothetical protein [Methylobacteriaceae bacterium]
MAFLNDPVQDVERPVGVRRGAPRPLRAVAAAFGGFALVAAAAAGLFLFRLSQGPMELAFVGRSIETELERSFGRGVDIALDRAFIENGAHGLAVVVDRLAIRDADGSLIVDAPRAEVTIDSAALLLGRVAPRRLELAEIDLRLDRLADGSIALSAGPDQSGAIPFARGGAPRVGARKDGDPPPEPTPLGQAAADALRALADAATDAAGPLGGLERIGVTRGNLIVTDVVSGRKTSFRGVDLAFDRAESGQSATVYLSALGPNGRWTAVARVGAATGAERRLEIEIRDLSLDEIALLAGFRERPVDFDMPISARLAVTAAADGAIAAASGRFTFGAGYVKLDDPDHEPFLVDEVVGGFRWDEARGAILLEPTQLSAGDTQFALEGAIAPPAHAGGEWRVELASRDNRLGGERPGETPLALGKLTLSARYASPEARLTIDRLELDGKDVGLVLSGEVIGGDAGPAMKLDLNASRMAARSFVRLWPSFIAPETRAWFLRGLTGGMLEKGVLKVAFDRQAFERLRAQQPPAQDAVLLEFAISDATLDYLPGAPPLVGVAGAGRVTGASAIFRATRAETLPAPGKRLTVTEALFEVPDFGVKPTPATLRLAVQGGVDVAMELLAKPAFRDFSDVPAQARNARGQLDARIDVAMRLGSDKPGDVQTRVQAHAANVTLEQVLGGEKFEAAALAVSADSGGLTVKGEGRILGAPAQIEMKKPAGQAGEAVVSVTLDEGQRARRGFAVAGLSGPVAARFAAGLGDGKTRGRRAQVEVDFTRAVFDNLAGAVSKPAGRPAKASFALIDSEGGYTLDNLQFEGGGASIRGAVQLAGDGQFVSARLSQVRLSPGDDLRVEATRAGEAVKIVARGASVDARPFLKAMTGGKESGGKAFELDLKATLLTGHNKQAIANAELRLARAGGRTRATELTGRFGRDPVSVALAQDGQGLAVDSHDAGAALAFLDLYKRMEGGRLVGVVRFEGERVDASFNIKDFALRDEPAVRRLVAESAATRTELAGAKVDTQVVKFSRLQARLSRAGDRLTVHEAVLSGQTMGLTVEGSIDLRGERLQMRGAFVPAYGINNFFAKLPLFGPILGGGSNEGLFAVNYRLSGSMAAPVVAVNPLSAIAPGFLRHIFGAVGGDGGAAAPAAQNGVDATMRPRVPARPQPPMSIAPQR